MRNVLCKASLEVRAASRLLCTHLRGSQTKGQATMGGQEQTYRGQQRETPTKGHTAWKP